MQQRRIRTPCRSHRRECAPTSFRIFILRTRYCHWAQTAEALCGTVLKLCLFNRDENGNLWDTPSCFGLNKQDPGQWFSHQLGKSKWWSISLQVRSISQPFRFERISHGWFFAPNTVLGSRNSGVEICSSRIDWHHTQHHIAHLAVQRILKFK